MLSCALCPFSLFQPTARSASRTPLTLRRPSKGVSGLAGTAGSGDNLQDILRILTLWFNHGAAADVEAALQDGFSRVSIDTWLVVIPQARARPQAPPAPCLLPLFRCLW